MRRKLLHGNPDTHRKKQRVFVREKRHRHVGLVELRRVQGAQHTTYRTPYCVHSRITVRGVVSGSSARGAAIREAVLIRAVPLRDDPKSRYRVFV